ncbi:DUF6387 family protein [Burkholderia vietnamiensis]|uniref:DUF6387 family protein n=1 Tax=Burkholderia vietnamiensis TaxID=60552 RepID=UPI000ABCDCB5|nr:DUF6387 family protein [Burkholderia vietnamiensis]MCA7986538.1 DUF6387 family protein [Burkholderia vietnamiensis]HDR8931582.1 hypothetical protein [Burkholderia vietnamiensis]
MANGVNKSITSPPGFDIKKYTGTETFTLSDWATSINARMWRAKMYRFRSLPHASPEEAEHIRSMALDGILAVFTDPLSAYRGWLDTHERAHGNGANVRDMNIIDCMMIKHAADLRKDDPPPMVPIDEYDESFRRWLNNDSSSNDEELLRQPYWKVDGVLPDGPNRIAKHGRIHLSVELHASEERQVSDFIRWLREAKAAMGIPEKRNLFTQADMRKWHRNRVLAYSDVKCWCDAAGVEIDDYRMGLLLFPDDLESANPADKIRKSVRPAAEEVFTHTFAEALMDQARLEADQR